MRVLAIRGRNLASLGDAFEVDLQRPPLSDVGLFAITGPTGAGKSTILDALCLALFDQVPRLPGGTACWSGVPTRTTPSGSRRPMSARSCGAGRATALPRSTSWATTAAATAHAGRSGARAGVPTAGCRRRPSVSPTSTPARLSRRPRPRCSTRSRGGSGSPSSSSAVRCCWRRATSRRSSRPTPTSARTCSSASPARRSTASCRSRPTSARGPRAPRSPSCARVSRTSCPCRRPSGRGSSADARSWRPTSESRPPSGSRSGRSLPGTSATPRCWKRSSRHARVLPMPRPSGSARRIGDASWRPSFGHSPCGRRCRPWPMQRLPRPPRRSSARRQRRRSSRPGRPPRRRPPGAGRRPGNWTRPDGGAWTSATTS